MKTLLEIQNEVAIEEGGAKWESVTPTAQFMFWPEVCRRAQLECARETLKEASERAKSVHYSNEMKSVILDEANIKLIQ